MITLKVTSWCARIPYHYSALITMHLASFRKFLGCKIKYLVLVDMLKPYRLDDLCEMVRHLMASGDWLDERDLSMLLFQCVTCGRGEDVRARHFNELVKPLFRRSIGGLNAWWTYTPRCPNAMPDIFSSIKSCYRGNMTIEMRY
jgi:hypothetical protein